MGAEYTVPGAQAVRTEGVAAAAVVGDLAGTGGLLAGPGGCLRYLAAGTGLGCPRPAQWMWTGWDWSLDAGATAVRPAAARALAIDILVASNRSSSLTEPFPDRSSVPVARLRRLCVP